MNDACAPARRRFLGAAAMLALGACAQSRPQVYLPSPPPLTTGYADVNGTRLYYEVSGAGDPVVLLHAFMLDARMWDDQAEALARNFRVIRYDARGFGRSAAPGSRERYSPVDDLDQLLAQLGVQSVHLVGVAMGARVALDYALTLPEKVRSVVAISPVIGGWQWSAEWLASYAPIVQAGRRGDVAGAKALWLAHPVFATARAKPAVAARLEQMVNEYSGWHFANASAERVVTPPAVDRLGAVRARTLSLEGERDLSEFHRMAEKIEHDVAGAKRATVSGAGHMANMEMPEAVNQALRSFLRPA